MTNKPPTKSADRLALIWEIRTARILSIGISPEEIERFRFLADKRNGYPGLNEAEKSEYERYRGLVI